MKLKLLLFISIFILASCSSKNKTDEIARYNYDEKISDANPELIKKVGNWLDKDVICYGLIVSINEEGKPVRGKPVKAKVTKMAGNEISMKALETINIAVNQGCSNLSIKKGTVWVETEGELFKTKEDAEKYLILKNLLMD